MKTLKNKLFAVGMEALGVLLTAVYGDGTFLVFISMFAIPLFFAKQNYIY
jgi:hypothetical protein